MVDILRLGSLLPSVVSYCWMSDKNGTCDVITHATYLQRFSTRTSAKMKLSGKPTNPCSAGKPLLEDVLAVVKLK